MKRTIVMLATASVVALGMILHLGRVRSSPVEREQAPAFDPAEHHYRQATPPVTWSRFLRQP